MVSWTPARILVVLVLGAGVGACFNAPSAAVMFACDPAGEAACPAGYTCAKDACCHRDGTEVTADNFGTCQIGGGPISTSGGTTTPTSGGTTSAGTSGEATTGVASTTSSGSTSGSTGTSSTGTSTGETTGASETGGTGTSGMDTSTGMMTTGGTTAGETTG